MVSNLASDNSNPTDQSKKTLERVMDDKIFFYDSKNAYIMNCIDYKNTKEKIKTDFDDGKPYFYCKIFKIICLNNY